MRWIVGIDSRARSHGALVFCEWVAANTRAADEDRFEAVHVLEQRQVAPFQPHVSLSEIERMTREALAASLPVGRFSEIDLVHETTADVALAHKVGGAPDCVLVLGRKAGRDGSGLTRLGRTARRLARTLPAPVLVVPRDLETVGAGPILVATNLREDSDGAAELAKRLATRLHRELAVVHVVAAIDEQPPHFVPAATRQQLLAQLRLEGERDLEVWRRRHALTRANAAVAAGDPVDRLQGIAQEEDAAMIVVGSRRLSLGERFYLSSVGSDLAGSASVPVLIAPPPA